MRAGTRAALCVYVPYVLSATLEFLRAVARECGVPVSLLRDMVQCVGSRLLSCHCGVDFCGRGAALVAARETQRPPALRGSNQRVFRPPGRPCRKESQTFSLIPFRILWIATAVGCQSTHARLRSPSRGGQPALLQLALLEPETTAGQPAPVSTKAPRARDHCRQPAPCLQKLPGTRDHCRQPAPCLQRFLVLSSEGNRPSSLEQDLLPETAAGNRPRVFKSSCESKTGTPGDNQSHSEPALPVQ